MEQKEYAGLRSLRDFLNKLKKLFATKTEAKVFVAISYETAFQEIIDAVNAGRVVQAIDENGILYNLATTLNGEGCVFTQTDGSCVYALIVTADNQWQQGNVLFPNAEDYYTTNIIDTLLVNKANATHTHDDRYYTETEIDEMNQSVVQDVGNLILKMYDNGRDFTAEDQVRPIRQIANDEANKTLETAKSYTDTKTSDLASTSSVNTSISTHNTSNSTHNDIRDLIAGLTTRLNALANSDDTTLDQMSEVVAYIKNNKNLIDGITTSKVNVSDIINNLTTNVTNKPLSAAQGVAIKSLIDALQDELDSHTHAISDVSGLQSALDGKAASSHGTHVSYSTTAPVMDGSASVGSASTVARSDHKHPTDTSRASKTEFDTHTSNKSNPHGVTKSQVGLGNVDNTSDINKPVSAAQATAILDAKTKDVSGNAFQRVFCSMIPYGTSIPANADINTTTYLKVGNFYCSKNADVATMTNCPTTMAFMMQVYSPLSTTIDNETSKTWVYRLRKIIDHKGNEWYQSVNSGGTAGTFTYNAWQKILKDTDTATTSKNGAMSKDMVTKLNGIAAGANKTTVDSVLSASSTNPVQNKAVTTKLNEVAGLVNQMVSDKADKSGLTLGVHTDGLVYLFVNGVPQGSGLDIKADVVEGDISGYIEDNNVITLRGDLPDGTYTLRFEHSDGSFSPVGGLEVDDVADSYAATYRLTNCTISHNPAVVTQDYHAFVYADDGYELQSVEVLMGGVDVTNLYVDSNEINIPKLTGVLVITAVAEKAAAMVNQIPISTDSSGNHFNGGKGWKTGYRLSLSGGGESALANYECTGFIPCTATDDICIKDIGINNENNSNITCYDSNKQPISVNGSNKGTSLYQLFVTDGTYKGNGVYASSLTNCSLFTNLSNVAYIRIGSSRITDESIVAINQNITTSYTNLIPLSVNESGSDYVGTNSEDGYKAGFRIKSSGVEQAESTAYCSGFIRYENMTYVYLKNISLSSNSNANAIAFYNTDKQLVKQAVFGDPSLGYSWIQLENGVWRFDVIGISSSVPVSEGYLRFSCGSITDDTILTIDEQISSNLSQFTIEGTTYQFEEGMTWEQWLESDYNTTNLETGEYDESMGGYTIMPEDDHSLALSGTTQEWAVTTDVIVAGTAYETIMW